MPSKPKDISASRVSECTTDPRQSHPLPPADQPDADSGEHGDEGAARSLSAEGGDGPAGGVAGAASPGLLISPYLHGKSVGAGGGLGFAGSGQVESAGCLAAAMVGGVRDSGRSSRDTCRLVIGPGMIRLSAPNEDAVPAEDGDDRACRGQITGWSHKSRRAMLQAFATCDYAPLVDCVSGMVTLTYPGDWERVAGDGRKPKRHFDALATRWTRAWGESPTWLWKMEFQARGAPHLHILTPIPQGLAGTTRGAGAGLRFRAWLSAVWADIVDRERERSREVMRSELSGSEWVERLAIDDGHYRRHLAAGTNVSIAQGLVATDARRVAAYFLKHGAAGGGKEYQHVVPQLWVESGSVGRFWGIRGFDRSTTIVDLDDYQYVLARRVLRRHSRHVAEYPPGHRYPTRVTKRRVPLFSNTFGGFTLVNLGPEFATKVAQAIRDW